MYFILLSLYINSTHNYKHFPNPSSTFFFLSKKKMAGGFAVETGKSKEHPGNLTPRVLWTCIFAASGGLIFGYDLGISGNNIHITFSFNVALFPKKKRRNYIKTTCVYINNQVEWRPWTRSWRSFFRRCTWRNRWSGHRTISTANTTAKRWRFSRRRCTWRRWFRRYVRRR